MPTRRQFLQKAGYGLVLLGGTEWSVTDARAATGRAGPIGSPAPDSAPPPHPGATKLAAKLWDGTSGVTATYYNKGALLPWQNYGGDWIDANGVAQGPAAFATVAARTVGPFSVDVTAVIQRGAQLFLRARGPGKIATRIHSDPSQRPKLDVDGVPYPCTACTVVNTASSMPVVGESLSPGNALVLAFDLSSLSGAIAKATLTLTLTHVFSVPLTLSAFALRPPRLFSGGTPTQGIAAGYTRDEGIAAHPDVYFAAPLDRQGIDAYFTGGKMPADYVYAMDPTLGVPALSVKYHVGEFGPFRPTPDHSWSKKDRVGVRVNASNGNLLRDDTPSAQYLALGHPHSPSELYFRYYLNLRKGYQCTTDGKKLPGLCGRYGKWMGNDKQGGYQPTAGNGGSPTRGTYSDVDGLSGWSMRHRAMVGPADANPYADLVAVDYYAYHAKMKGYYGDEWRWGNPSVGYANLEQDRWYCIEHYVKVNDVVGPFDAYGNGMAVENGIVRGWLDGVLVFEKTDAVLRKHPAIKVDEVWIDHYHGGMTPAEAEHPFQMAALVVAKNYIGPIQKRAIAPPVRPRDRRGSTGGR